ncbi:MAG: FAD binding domain-containing protein [Saccharofermentanales bacterium]
MAINYHKPHSLSEALRMRSDCEVTPYMGGTDIMVERDSEASFLFLGDLPELQQLTRDADGLHLGPGLTFSTLLAHEGCPKLLRESISRIASPAIRNLGTIGGNICNASPAGDTLPVLLLYDTELVLKSLRGERSVSLDAFIVSRKHIDLRSDELLADIVMKPKSYNHFYYEKVGSRRAMSISKIAMAAAADIREGCVADFALSFASMYKTPLRFKDMEQAVKGKSLASLKAMKEEIVHAYDNRLHPISDMRSTATYRKGVSLNLIRDFIDTIVKISE